MPRPKIFTDEELRKRKNESTAKRYKENKEKISLYHKELRNKKKKEIPDFKKQEAERSAKWRKENIEKSINVNAKSKLKHPEKRNAATRKWFSENKDKRAAYQKKRKAEQKKRLPLWADLNEIKLFYALAKKMTEETGIQYVVDHVIPMQGKGVSGLHVETNLQVITALENNRKYNKMYE